MFGVPGSSARDDCVDALKRTMERERGWNSARRVAVVRQDVLEIRVCIYLKSFLPERVDLRVIRAVLRNHSSQSKLRVALSFPSGIVFIRQAVASAVDLVCRDPMCR